MGQKIKKNESNYKKIVLYCFIYGVDLWHDRCLRHRTDLCTYSK